MAHKIAKKTSLKPNGTLRLSLFILASFLLFVAAMVFFQVKAQPTTFCANSESCIKDLSSKKTADNTGTFMGHTVTAPTLPDKPIFALNETQNVLGETTTDYKHIYIDLTNQRLYAYEGSNKVFDFPVSTGKWGATPTGNFRIWIWLRYTRMSGGNSALGTYYNLPNVPYTMFYYNASVPKTQGYSIHGAYWHNNFGHPMSHGCVNMRIEDAGKIFYWTNPTADGTTYPTDSNPGTLITVYGTAPNE